MAAVNQILMVHLTTGSSNEGLPWSGGDRAAALPSVLAPGAGTPILTWYCQWARRFATSVFVLLPDHLKNQAESVVPFLGGAIPLWYSEDGLAGLPQHGRREQVWVVNGNQLPMVDWAEARTAVRRHRSDVMVFGKTAIEVGQHYEESVLVAETGEVLGFKRHYSDSPGFLDLHGDEASFLVAPGEHAPTVVNHVVARGWGLDSVGAMTRRFSVRWAPSRCVLAEVATRDGTAALRSIAGGSTAGATPDSWAPPNPELLDRASLHRGKAPARPEGSDSASTGDDTKPKGKNPFGRDSHRPAVDSASSDDPFRERRGPDAGHASPDAGADPDHRTRAKRTASQSLPGIQSDKAQQRKTRYLFWKRVIDVTVSATGLIVLSPLMAAVALLIKCTSKGPVFFAHQRQGAGGKEFPCLKFRSMRIGADELQEKLRSRNEVDGPQFKIENDPRLTPLGPWLRQTNIDELPQLINVLLGQMSLVGPRPSPDKENQLCPAWRRARLSVKPGVTGLWQVLRLRDDDQSDFQEWIYYDVEYARHQSLWLDFQLLLYTPISMFMPGRLRRFAERLRSRGICKHSARLAREIAAAA